MEILNTTSTLEKMIDLELLAILKSDLLNFKKSQQEQPIREEALKAA